MERKDKENLIQKTPDSSTEQLGNNKLLVASSRPRRLQQVTRLLSSQGCEIDTAGDAKTACSQALSTYYDLIIYDYEIPGMDVSKFIKAIKSASKHLLYRKVVFMITDRRSLLKSTQALLLYSQIKSVRLPVNDNFLNTINGLLHLRKIVTPLEYQWPTTLKEAAQRLLDNLSEEDKELLKNTDEVHLAKYHHGLGTCIRNNFGLWQGNTSLVLIDPKTGGRIIHPDDVSMFIIKKAHKALWGNKAKPHYSEELIENWNKILAQRRRHNSKQ
ncbi:MAG: hypothetical protein PHI10_04260 [Dehalococcoidales bacterium]|jgi:CheY-like chemotaxis protein|nr:hypothetical protein [Dehalococcoidales bacterium]